MASAAPVQVTIRRAVEADLPSVVRLFAIPEEGNKKPDHPFYERLGFVATHEGMTLSL